MIDFARQPVYIVAGGPSLSGFDFGRLAGRQVVAINRALEVLPGAALVWWSDELFWLNNRARILAHDGQLLTALRPSDRLREPYPLRVKVWRFTGLSGYDPEPGCIRSGNNSGFAALHAAVKLGARKIVLLGYDFDAPGPETHWHSGYGQHGGALWNRVLQTKMLPYFESLVPAFHERGVQIRVANPASRLVCWPRCSLEDALQW